MCQLMLDDNTEESHLRDSHVFGAAHDTIRISNTTHVLHCTVFVIRAHNMIDFGEGISMAVSLLVKVDSCLGYTCYQFMFKIFN